MTAKTKTRIPADFAVTDTHREWASRKHAAMHLPDVFIGEFKDHHAAKGTTMLDWDKAFTNWINWSSPAGRFYNDMDWAKRIKAARAMEPRVARTTQPPAVVAGRYVDADGKPVGQPPIPAVNASDIARRMLADARKALKGARA